MSHNAIEQTEINYRAVRDLDDVKAKGKASIIRLQKSWFYVCMYR